MIYESKEYKITKSAIDLKLFQEINLKQHCPIENNFASSKRNYNTEMSVGLPNIPFCYAFQQLAQVFFIFMCFLQILK